LILFFIPLNLYIIGRAFGFGLQWSLFRYQESGMGNSFISIFQDINYVINGQYTGITAFSTVLWVFGAVLMIPALVLLFIPVFKTINMSKISGIITICAGIFMVFSLIVHYGLRFNGPAGTAIPVGLPVMFVIGGWMFTEGRKEETGDDEEDLHEVDEGSV